ncbi:MAG TPA: GntR family transcriptional regulator [Gemmatimonadaceae bacterium]|nr:GntR family transcriptional regulator [Gemmatimonadaceae bacterium]
MSVAISIQPGSTVPIYRQIVEQICAAVLAGRLRDDETLPSVRTLAEELVVNPNTVARAYSELARDGIVEARAGRGMFVSQRRRIYSAAERARRMEQAVTSFVSEAFVLGYSSEEIIDLVARRTQAANARSSTPGKRGHR